MSAVPKQRAFLAAFAQTASITKAAAACKLDRGLHYQWLETLPEYPAEFTRAKELAADALIDEAVRRAHVGVEEPLVYQGQFTYPRECYRKDGKLRKNAKPLMVYKASDALMMFLLKGLRPETFRENVKVEHTGAINLIERLNAGRDRLKNKITSAEVSDS